MAFLEYEMQEKATYLLTCNDLISYLSEIIIFLETIKGGMELKQQHVNFSNKMSRWITFCKCVFLKRESVSQCKFLLYSA